MLTIVKSYVTFNADEAKSAVTKIKEALAIVKKWMAQNFLCLNDGQNRGFTNKI